MVCPCALSMDYLYVDRKNREVWLTSDPESASSLAYHKFILVFQNTPVDLEATVWIVRIAHIVVAMGYFSGM